MDALDRFHPTVAPATRWHLRVTISLAAEGLRQAFTAAVSVVEHAAGGPATIVELLTSDDFDVRKGLDTLPELVSVTEAAQELGVSRQAVLERLERGTLRGSKVGSTWVIQASAVT